MFSLFKPHTPEAMATSELKQARMELLQANAQLEYWLAMSSCLNERVQRLEKVVEEDQARPQWPRRPPPMATPNLPDPFPPH
jgi:hypothetical protein